MPCSYKIETEEKDNQENIKEISLVKKFSQKLSHELENVKEQIKGLKAKIV